MIFLFIIYDRLAFYLSLNYSIELNERFQDFENQKFLIEKAKEEKKTIEDEADHLRREIQTMKKVKDKLFLEV